MKRILDFSHYLLSETVSKGDTVIDATAGNGYDTVFLSKLVGKHGKVLAFDIQLQAITTVKEKLQSNQITNTIVIHDGHENASDYLDEYDTVGGAIFNLGYLPGSNKSIITRKDTTIKAIEAILPKVKKGGLIVLVIYHGHEGGKEEKEGILSYASALSQKQFSVLHYSFINQKNTPPFIIAIEKR